jgi:hypothetical protein
LWQANSASTHVVLKSLKGAAELRNMRLGTRLATAMMVVGLMVAGASISTASAGTGCDLYASPGGSASGSGSLGDPLASPQQLDWALAPGQTGCLLSGTYGSLSSAQRLTTDGTPSGRITITTAPGQSAKVVGLVELEGSYTTVSGLAIDGSNRLYDAERSGTNCPYPVSNGLEIDGRGDIFQDNDFYQSVAGLRGNGIGIGWNHPADGAIIRDNRIHDLGQCQAYDQMIYLAHGNGVQIYDNWMWNDPHGWGVQVYPAATNAHIHDNVIDGAGSGFVLGGSSQVADNAIDHNVVINSTGLPNAGLSGVGVSTCCGLGAGNSFTDNVVYNNPGGIAAARGLAVSGNTTKAPKFADAAAHDYRPTTASPDVISHWSLWNGHAGSMPIAIPASVHVHARMTRHRKAGRRHRTKHRHHRRTRR